MVLAAYLAVGTVLHCFHSHHVCDHSTHATNLAVAAAECYGHGQCVQSAIDHDSDDAHCAVCRFLAQSSTQLEVAKLPAIAKAEPYCITSEAGRIFCEPAGPWHSRAPPLFAEI